MSGPKRSDVEAELRQALRAAERAQGAIADSQSKSLDSMLRRASDAVSGVGGDPLRDVASSLTGARSDVPAVGAAKASVEAAGTALSRARQSVDSARREGDQAKKLTVDAASAFNSAMSEYKRARAALDKSGGHYLSSEMGWAKAARAHLEKAERLAAQASAARTKAAKSATQALAVATAAGGAVGTASKAARAARAESDERTRAEQEARRIAEAARQRATIAVGGARSALGGLNATDADKFRPGERAKLQHSLDAAQAALNRGDSAGAERLASGIPSQTERLAANVAAARAEFDRQLAEASAAASSLESAIAAADGDLIQSWSDDPQAITSARAALTRAQSMITSEQFDDATTLAAGQVRAVDAATVSASETRAAHERRESIGEAVMDVLEEMGFDVSFEPGTRTDPLRISGQTPEEAAAAGDFDIEIPLAGEVHFEVTAQEGDGACAQSVKGLQDKLAERGVGWNTTDWGYGQDPATRTSTSQHPTPQYTHGDHQQRTYGH